MKILILIATLIAGYLIGSVNVSVIVSKVAYKSDIRKHGSGNAGATNMARVYGLLGGIIVLIGDFGKCFLAMSIAKRVGGALGEYCSLIAGAGCLIGHAFPLYFKFKGGKGVTVGSAIALMIDWRALLIVLGVFVLMFVITRIVSISSIVASASFVIVVVAFYAFQGTANLITIYELMLSVFSAVTVIALHHSNIKRILDGTEKKFTYKKREKK